MPEIEIELEPIAEGQAELAREIGSWRLRESAYWISDIQVGRPRIWELFPTHKRAMPGPMAHRATQYTQPYPGRVAIIVYQD